MGRKSPCSPPSSAGSITKLEPRPQDGPLKTTTVRDAHRNTPLGCSSSSSNQHQSSDKLGSEGDHSQSTTKSEPRDQFLKKWRHRLATLKRSVGIQTGPLITETEEDIKIDGLVFSCLKHELDQWKQSYLHLKASQDTIHLSASRHFTALEEQVKALEKANNTLKAHLRRCGANPDDVWAMEKELRQRASQTWATGLEYRIERDLAHGNYTAADEFSYV